MTNDVVFDSSSGIPVEEQKEILAKINGIAEKRRRHLSESAGEEAVIKAKNNSAFFPLLVNITALVLLCAGAWFIFYFNGKKDVQVRLGTGTYDSAEKALISEIRKDPAMSELEHLSYDQEKADVIEAQLAGGLETISDLIKEAKYDQAAKSIENYRYINNKGVFPSSRSAQAKKEFYNKAFDSMETMITHLRVTGGADSLELFAKNEQLEAKVNEMQKTLDSFSGSSGQQARRLKEVETKLETTVAEKDKTIASLESEKNSLKQSVSDLNDVAAGKDQKIAELQSQLDIIRQLLKD